VCGVLPSVYLSWRPRGHGGGSGRRLVYRAAVPQPGGGRPPPAPRCPMASCAQLLCRPSCLPLPKPQFVDRPVRGGAAPATAHGVAYATADFSSPLLARTNSPPRHLPSLYAAPLFWDPGMFALNPKPPLPRVPDAVANTISVHMHIHTCIRLHIHIYIHIYIYIYIYIYRYVCVCRC